MDPYRQEKVNLRERFARWLAEDPAAQARLRDARLVGRIVGWPLNTYAPRSKRHGDRLMLIGDAANLVDPINGEGIHTALESAQIAARIADEALRAGDLGETFLARYDRCWRDASDLDLRIGNLYVTLAGNRSLTGAWLFALRLVGHTAKRNRAYARIITGILAGVLPTRRSLSPGFILKTVLHSPHTYAKLMGVPSANPRDLLSWGWATLKATAGLLADIRREPGSALLWSKEVVSAGLSLLARLSDRDRHVSSRR